jgi:type IV secretion system protein VirD4
MKLCRILLILSILLAVCGSFLIIGWWTVLFAIPLLKRTHKRFTAFGTARFADESDIAPNSNGLLVGQITISGRSVSKLFDPQVNSVDACNAFWGITKKRQVRVDAIHAAIFAPTGVGKGVSFVIPHGLTCDESTVFVDIKGEVAKATIEARKKMGHRVVLLDPFHVVTDTPDTFNPLDFIDADSPLAIDDCRALAEALVVRTGRESEPHWCDSAEINIAGITSFVVKHAPKEDRSLQTVRDLLTNPEELEAAINVMRQSPAWDGMLARMGNQLTHFKDKELASSLTTIGRFLRFLDTLAIAESTKTSNFDLADLLTGKMSMFLILPPEYMRTQSALLRMWIGSLLRAVVRGGLSNRRVHFVLDEAASLGHMDCLDDALALGRGYGVRTQWYFQSMAQLKKSFPEGQDQTLLSATTQVFFGVQDLPTAEYVSARLGEETIIIESGGTSTGQSHQASGSGTRGSTSYSVTTSDNWQQHAHKLLDPAQVLALGERIAITFTPGIPPIWTTLVRYYESGFSKPGRSAEMWSGAKMVVMCVSVFVAMSLAALCLLGMRFNH